jgi:adenine-specific DNA-methyltransferase
LVIYEEDEIERMVEIIQQEIKNNKGQKLLFKIYVFSNGQYPYTEEFEEVLEYITLCALPDAIYKAYHNVLPKRHQKAIPKLDEETPEPIQNNTENDSLDLFSQR